MPTIPDPAPMVTGGVDTHAEVHVAAVVDGIGRVLGTREFPATADGHTTALAWMRQFGPLATVGVEGTGSYGAGLARHLAGVGVRVVEVIRPNRQTRRRGKSDAIDAVAAALAALNGDASGQPKSRDGAVESIRMPRVARRGAMKARTQAADQLRDLIITAPEPLRAALAPQSTAGRVATAAAFTPVHLCDPIHAAQAAMAVVARRHRQLTDEIDQLVQAAAPSTLLAKQGVATQVRDPAGCGRRQPDPPGQRRLVAHRVHPHVLRPADQGVRGPTDRRGQDHQRDHAMP